MYDYYPYRKKNRHNNNCVIRKNILQGKTLQIRIGGELRKEIEVLAKGLNQDDSKLARDILEDFFLTLRLRKEKEEVEHFLENI